MENIYPQQLVAELRDCFGQYSEVCALAEGHDVALIACLRKIANMTWTGRDLLVELNAPGDGFNHGIRRRADSVAKACIFLYDAQRAYEVFCRKEYGECTQCGRALVLEAELRHGNQWYICEMCNTGYGKHPELRPRETVGFQG